MKGVKGSLDKCSVNWSYWTFTSQYLHSSIVKRPFLNSKVYYLPSQSGLPTRWCNPVIGIQLG